MSYKVKTKIIEYLTKNEWKYNQKFSHYKEEDYIISDYLIENYSKNPIRFYWIIDLIVECDKISKDYLIKEIEELIIN